MKKWINRLNICVLSCVAATLLSAGGISYSRARQIEMPVLAKHKTRLPKNSFEFGQSCCKDLGKYVFALNYVAPKMQIPDLRHLLTYYGKNGRPDAQSDHPMLYFSFQNNPKIKVIDPREKIYLQYNKKKCGTGNYSFSPSNRETSLWLNAEIDDENVGISVSMIDENGNLVSEPKEYANFNLSEKQLTRTASQGWELGKWRVDGTLLARQRARWMGQDKFLENHGGEEYKERAGKHRIDFGEKDQIYSVYVDNEDSLVWKDGKWEKVSPGRDSKGLPLLFVKKVDERLMGFELWDPEGKRKVKLNLLRSMETWMPSEIQQDFKFIGARTRSQFVFEVDDEKMLLSPHDWLLLTEDGWKKLTTAQQIDEYVDRKEIGTLFVFDGIVREDDNQVIKGLLYNPSRTQVQNIELPVQKDGLAYNQIDRTKVKRKRYKKEASMAEARDPKRGKAYWRNKLKNNLYP